jgi:hypothetical protein
MSDNITNKYCVCERGILFQPARWKAYLRNLQSAENDSEGGNGADKSIYHIFHSQMLWFTRDEANGHNKIAGEHLKRCDAALEDCTMIVDALEEKLANTPKPSEVLDWYSLW